MHRALAAYLTARDWLLAAAFAARICWPQMRLIAAAPRVGGPKAKRSGAGAPAVPWPCPTDRDRHEATRARAELCARCFVGVGLS